MSKKNSINVSALGLSLGVLSGLSVAFTALLSLYGGGFGQEFVELIAAIYPGYAATWSGAFVGFLFGFIDGFIGGTLIGVFYNYFCQCGKK